MIKIMRKETAAQVKLEFEVSGAGNWEYTFTNNRGNVVDAQLLVNQLVEALDSKVQEVRREAYNAGWADKAAKRAKSQWFSCRI